VICDIDYGYNFIIYTILCFINLRMSTLKILEFRKQEILLSLICPSLTVMAVICLVLKYLTGMLFFSVKWCAVNSLTLYIAVVNVYHVL
jgi:hypothetical protein